MITSDVEDAYAEAFRAQVERSQDMAAHDEPGREFYYRPGELVIGRADQELVQRELLGLDSSGDVVRETEDVVVLRVDRDIPSLLEQLRQPTRWTDRPAPAVQPHHLVVGFGNVMGHPTRPPTAARALSPPTGKAASAGKGVTVGICDTGIWKEAEERHPDWLAGRYVPQVPDHEDLFSEGGSDLDLQAGHGTFVAGVLRQAAPGARFDPQKALDASGFGDELMLSAALDGLEPGVAVVNLSLGCVTADNLPSLPIARALARLPRSVVVVAAAGNAGSDRVSWPAGFKRVLAVGAVEESADGWVPSPWSNHGPWVDVSAGGLRTSTYVEGRMGVTGTVFRRFAQWAGTSFAAPHVAGRIAADIRPDEPSAWPAARRLLDQDPWHPDHGVLVVD